MSLLDTRLGEKMESEHYTTVCPKSRLSFFPGTQPEEKMRPKKVLGSAQFAGLPEKKNASQPQHLANAGHVARLLANMGALAHNAGFKTVCFYPSLKFQGEREREKKDQQVLGDSLN